MVIDRGVEIYPQLKRGVSLTPAGSGYLLALPTHGLLLTDGLHLQLARALDGKHSARELSALLHCSLDEFYNFAEMLAAEGLLDLLQEANEPESQDLSTKVATRRREIERSLLAHRGGVRDGGVEEFKGRENVTILISGENRIGRHLLASLRASGFTNTRLVSRAGLPPRIIGDDICGVLVRAGDIGKLRGEFTEELIRNAQISRGVLAAKNFPDLIISTIPVEWDYVQRWMSEGSPHLHINQIIGREIEIGPLVLPGVTPCLRCISLTKRDNLSGVTSESTRNEAPTAAVSYMAGLITLAVGAYFGSEQSALIATSHWYDLLDPMRGAEVRHWNFHPECGCR